MPALPLHYLGHLVGHARVDVELRELPLTLKWGLALPKALRSRHHNRADVLLARLLEEPTLLRRCFPLTQLRCRSAAYNLRLNKVAWQPDIVAHLCAYELSDEWPQRSYHLEQIAILATTTNRLFHLDNDRCNCSHNNLRELTSPSGLFHTDEECPPCIVPSPHPFMESF